MKVTKRLVLFIALFTFLNLQIAFASFDPNTDRSGGYRKMAEIKDSNGCKLFMEKFWRPPSSVLWNGKCVNENAEGEGTLDLVWDSISKPGTISAVGKFVGIYRNGLRTGYGEITLPENEKYLGNWENGEPNGLGERVFENGTEQFKGAWLNGLYHGYGVYKVNNRICGILGCGGKKETNEGYWVKGAFVRPCVSAIACEENNKLIVELSPKFTKSKNNLDCENARIISQKLQDAQQENSYFDFQACVDERSFNKLAATKTPRPIFLGAALLEDSGQRGRAKTLYRLIIEKFKDSPEAIKSADRLARLSDISAIELSQSQNAIEVSNQIKNSSFKACKVQQTACFGRCQGDSKCLTGCPICGN